MPNRSFPGALIACALAALPVCAPAAPGPQPIPFDQITAALNGVHQFSQVALTPDGRRFAYVDVVADHSAVRLADVARPAVRTRSPRVRGGAARRATSRGRPTAGGSRS